MKSPRRIRSRTGGFVEGLTIQGCFEGDFCVQHFADGAVGFCFGSGGLELLFGRAGNCGVEGEVDLCDRESCLLLDDGDLSRRFDFISGQIVSTEDSGQRHAETSGMSGRDEFFGVRALSFFESRCEGVGGVVEGVGFGGNGSFSVENSALPDCATGAYHSFVRLPGGDVKAWAGFGVGSVIL